MESHQRALDGYTEKLRAVKANAERLEDAVAGGQNLRVVVSASRTLRHDLAELLVGFQASLSACTLHPAPCALHPAPCALHPAPCTLHSAGLARCKGLFDDSGGLISNLPPSPLTSRHSGTTWTGIVYRDPQPRQPSQVLMTSLTERAWKTRAPSSNADLDYSTLALDEVPLRHGSKRACGSCKSDFMGRGPFTGQSWKACARALNQPFCSCRID